MYDRENEIHYWYRDDEVLDDEVLVDFRDDEPPLDFECWLESSPFIMSISVRRSCRVLPGVLDEVDLRFLLKVLRLFLLFLLLVGGGVGGAEGDVSVTSSSSLLRAFAFLAKSAHACFIFFCKFAISSSVTMSFSIKDQIIWQRRLSSSELLNN